MGDDGQFDFEALDEDNAEEAEQEKDGDYELFEDDEEGISCASFGSLRPQYIDVLSDWVRRATARYQKGLVGADPGPLVRPSCHGVAGKDARIGEEWQTLGACGVL